MALLSDGVISLRCLKQPTMKTFLVLLRPEIKFFEIIGHPSEMDHSPSFYL